MEEKIIISFTSWKKRVSYCKNTFEIMLNQTLRPDKIILWLSEEEFPHKENDLPKELNDFVLTHKEVCEIRWVFKNNFVWKKFMYTLDLYPNDVILPIDDDIDYPKDYIEKMYDEYLFWGKKCPIVCYPNFYRDKNGVTNKNVYCHSGAFSLISKKFLGETIKKWYSEIIEPTLYNKWHSDDIYTYAIWFNGYRYKFCDKINGKNIYNSSSKNKIDPYSVNYNEEFRKRRNENLKLFDKYLLNTYNKTIEDFFEAPLIVSITTWKKRDVSLIKMLEHLKFQTKKPDKVILWLSEEEYNNKIPQHLLNAKGRGLIDEIFFTKGNIYVHKRWEIIKNYSNCYIAILDDDIIYPNDYFELLYKTCKNLQQPCCYYGKTIDYIDTKLVDLSFQNQSAKNHLYCGLVCIPPFTLPFEMFNNKNTSLRDEYCKFCDEAWNQAWLIKLGVNVFLLKKFNRLNTIDNTQECSIWLNHSSKPVDGIMTKVRNMANAIKVLKIEDKAQKIFNQFNIDKCCDKKLIMDNRKIIVTLTSWKGRINIVSNVIQSILNQDLKPNKIVLNLSHEEFPNKEKDLPDDIICLTNNEVFEIFWVEENNKQFKKLIPTLKRFPNDIIISVDDDFIYKNNFISCLYNDFIKNNCEYPITTFKNTKTTNDVYGTLATHAGVGTITMSKFYDQHINILYDNLVKPNLKKGIKCFDDTIYTYAALLNNVKYKSCSLDFRKLTLKEIETNNGVSSKSFKRLIEWHEEIRDFIKNKYNKIFIKSVGLKELSLDNNIEKQNIKLENKIQTSKKKKSTNEYTFKGDFYSFTQ